MALGTERRLKYAPFRPVGDGWSFRLHVERLCPDGEWGRRFLYGRKARGAERLSDFSSMIATSSVWANTRRTPKERCVGSAESERGSRRHGNHRFFRQEKGEEMPNRQVAEWHFFCWYCKNTVNAENRVKCPYCGACLFLNPQDYKELEEAGIKP